jgi:hypothetical protein
MPVSVVCPQLTDASARSRLHAAVADSIKRFRPGFEKWQLTIFRSQHGDGWDLAITGPRFRRVLTLHGPAEDLPGLVSAYVDAMLPKST